RAGALPPAGKLLLLAPEGGRVHGGRSLHRRLGSRRPSDPARRRSRCRGPRRRRTAARISAAGTRSQPRPRRRARRPGAGVCPRDAHLGAQRPGRARLVRAFTGAGGMSRVLVTGAAGFIGSHLCEALLARGDDVLGVDCFTETYSAERKRANLTEALAAGLEFKRLDLTRDGLDPVLRGVEVVYHLAAQPGVRSSWGEDFDVYARRNLVA